MRNHILTALSEAQKSLDLLIQDKGSVDAMEKAAKTIISCFENSGRVFSCGNGGSMCDAMHFAEELSGRFRKNRKGLPAIAISDPGYLSCVSNDFGYEDVFSRYIESHAGKGDCLLGISTSGTSRNVIKAALLARDKELAIITLTGRPGSELGKIADIDICAQGGEFADRSQELHIKIIHILIELVERKLFPENY